MANILIFSETTAQSVKSVTLEILGKLASGGHALEVATIGKVSEEGKQQLSQYGATHIYSMMGMSSESYSPGGHTRALQSLIQSKKYDYVFAGATSLGKDFFPRLAGSLDAGMASEVTNFTIENDTFSGVRPLFAGKCLAKVEIDGPRPHFVTVRPNALGLPESPVAGQPGEEEVQVTAESDLRDVVKSVLKGTSEKLDLTEANIIVSGGRSLKSAENFKILHELADVLGATVGASRAAVDSGYAPHAMQVGQTGKTVSPTLYIACGISGAIQHLAGMRTSKIIVAINTDPDAPIFAKADYGIVGDLFQIVPLLTEEFKQLLG